MRKHRTTCDRCSHLRSGKNKSIKCMIVFEETGHKYCHHCGYDSAKEDKGQPERTYTKPSQKLPQVTSGEFTSMYRDRGITDAVIVRNRISWTGKEMMFPYFLRDEIVNVKYRSPDKSFRQEANAMKIFYGMNDIIGESDVYIVEGEFDKLACEVAGFENVVSVPDGAPSVEAQTYNTKFEFIDNWEHLFEGAERIIIAVDADAPGKKLEGELIRRFGPERCWLIHWPEGCKDANEVLMEHGMLGLMESLETPDQIPIDGVFTSEDYYEELLSLYDNGLQGGESTGWADVDELYTVRPGEMCIVTGIPSHGKSSWLTALTINLAKSLDWKFGVFTPENQPMQRYIASIAANYIEKPFKEGAHERMSREEVKEAAIWTGKHFYFMQPDDNSFQVGSLLKMAKNIVKRYGINGLVLDPWNEIDHTRRSGVTETEYISTKLTEIRRFARLYQCHVWIVAHPKMMMRDAKGDYPVPTAYDISGSAHWYNKADDIVVVHRDTAVEKKNVSIYIQKVRFREVGRIGEAHLSFEVMTGRYDKAGHFQQHYGNM